MRVLVLIRRVTVDESSHRRLADVLLYKCGFAAQHTLYHLFTGDREDPSTWEYCQTVESAKEAKAALLDETTDNMFYETEVEAEPVSHAIHNIRHMLDRIMEEAKCHNYVMVLSGDNNFRLDVATTLPYKGNRDKTHRPIHYDAMREYMIRKHPHVVADGMEGDDMLGIMQTANMSGTVICSIDKDMLMIPGLHYNLDKGYTIEIDRATGYRIFFQQLITGDRTDNIPGLAGMGPVKADKLLSSLPREQWWPAIADLYMQQYEDPWVIYEQAYLLWILRFPEEIKRPVQWWRIYEQDVSPHAG